MKAFNWFILSWVLLSFNLLAEDEFNIKIDVEEENIAVNKKVASDALNAESVKSIHLAKEVNKRVIRFQEGRLFSKTLLSWCVAEGVKCKWVLDYDYKIMNSMGFEGDTKTIFNDLAIQYHNDNVNVKIVYYQAIDSYYFVEDM